MKKQMIISIFMVSGILLSGSIAAQDIFQLIKENKIEEIKKLINKDPSIVKVKDKFGFTPLHWAARKDHEAIVQLLLDRGADINAKNNDGDTPLLWATEYEAIVKLLLDKGADVNVTNNYGWTPLHRGCIGGHEVTARLLLDGGAKVNAADNKGHTPLHEAALLGHESIIKLLLKNGAEVNATISGGFWAGSTPLHVAASQGHMDIVKLLVEKGASVTLKDKDGKTAAQVAKTDAIKKYLLAKEKAAKK